MVRKSGAAHTTPLQFHFLTDVPTPWDIFFAVSPFSVLAYVVLSISS